MAAMEVGVQKIEAFLRLSAVLALVLTACLLGFDSETKEIFYIQKKASFKYLRALEGLVYITCVAAVYNLVQLCCFSLSSRCSGNSVESYRNLGWLRYILDQVAVYVEFAGYLAAVEHSLLVLTGEKHFEWVKWCNMYGRFCFQIGGSLLCCFVSCLLMISIAIISAFNLFRLYSSKKFLLPKPTPSSI